MEHDLDMVMSSRRFLKNVVIMKMYDSDACDADDEVHKHCTASSPAKVTHNSFQSKSQSISKSGPGTSCSMFLFLRIFLSVVPHINIADKKAGLVFLVQWTQCRPLLALPCLKLRFRFIPILNVTENFRQKTAIAVLRPK
ncbi:unnamed protein product [Sphenostylis stenocarpa]|uniref:Uncharacterized protein n=1 Tax=Sphenostylis stenocarpa TaxID=92480 RepID=A0AA86T835_9FABA|nr:unnamed protein product [Sphenostylis stenocarpa]